MSFPILGQPNTGDTAWMLASSALVLLMTPGLAFFYGGMVRTRSVLNMLMMSISAMGVVTVLWVLYGYSMSFGNDVGGVVGNPTDYWGLQGSHRWQRRGRRPEQGHCGGGHPAGRYLARHRLRGLPADVRDHHGRADLGRHGRPAEVQRLAGVRRAVGDGGLLPGRALGLRVRRVRVRARRLDRQQAARDRLRRWHRGPHQLRCGRPGAGDRAGQAQGLAHDAVPPAQRAVRDARRGIAVVRLVRVQRRFGDQRQRRRPGRRS